MHCEAGTAAAIPLASARGRQLGMRTGAKLGRNRQMIAAGNARRWMQHDGLTDRPALRIQRLLHAQRPTMPIFAQHRAFALADEAKMQLGMPARRMLGRRYGEARGHGRIIRESQGGGEYAGMRSVDLAGLSGNRCIRTRSWLDPTSALHRASGS